MKTYIRIFNWKEVNDFIHSQRNLNKSLTCPCAGTFMSAGRNLDTGEIKESVFPEVVVLAFHAVDTLTLVTGESELFVIVVDPRIETGHQRQEDTQYRQPVAASSGGVLGHTHHVKRDHNASHSTSSCCSHGDDSSNDTEDNSSFFP